jgi:hypothetical protein
MDLTRKIILATDLSHHFKILKDLKKLARGKICIWTTYSCTRLNWIWNESSQMVLNCCMNEAEHDMKNFHVWSLCYQTKPDAKVDNIKFRLVNSSYLAKTEFNNCFISLLKIWKRHPLRRHVVEYYVKYWVDITISQLAVSQLWKCDLIT